MKILLLTIISITFSFSAYAAPIKVPTLKICLAANGTMSAKTKCAKNETTASSSNFQSVGAQGVSGPQGPQGPQGPAGQKGSDGILKLATCRTVSSLDSLISGANDITTLSLRCTSAEFLLAHSGTTNDWDTSVIGTDLTYFPNESFPSGVDYYFARLEPINADTVTSFAYGVCCAR